MATSSNEEALFQAARLLAANARSSFLDHACAADASLRSRIDRRLLTEQADEESRPTLGELALPTARQRSIQQSPDEGVGQAIGSYKLLEQIGEGGCGSVYVAEQTEPIRRRVALKVIKLGMDTKAVIARFEAERQALALMDHPNIAKVLDAGSTQTGRPFFVMELVRGIRITDYCDDHHLPTQDRLRLFIKVCQAIQHAHQKGIIHRDIKPSNILVTIHDGVPTPKVIDFGIAKATEGRLTDATIYTQLHQFIGTPAYMSPEQAEMTSLDIDTRSDIYSLGVVLYELLTGRTPFEAQDLLACGIDVMRRTIREQEPARPSTRLAALAGDELTTTAKRRSSEVPKLVSLLKKDLDWVVMKCLEKDRTRRYETANGLAADLTRHLQHEPVIARPPTTAYRMQKSFRRNRAVFSAMAAVAIALIAGTAVSLWQAMSARKASAQAHREQERADQVAGVLKQMLETVGPSVARGRDTTLLREILTNTLARLDKEFGDRPQVEAEIRMMIGNTYRDLGDYASSVRMQSRVLELRQQLFGERSREVGEALNELAKALSLQGDAAQAEHLQREALAIWRESLGVRDIRVGDMLNDLGIMLYQNGKLHDAADAYSESLSIKEQCLKAPHQKLADAHLNLALLMRDLEQFTKGEEHARTSLKIYRDLFGDTHPNVAMALHNQGNVLFEMDRLKEAENALRSALQIYDKVYPQGHGYQAEAWADLGLILQNKGDLQGAKMAFQTGVAEGKKHLGEEHPQTVQNLRRLALLLGAEPTSYTESQALMLQAMSAARQNFSNQPALLVNALLDQAAFLLLKDSTKEAEVVLLEAYDLANRKLPSSRQLRIVCRRLKELHERQGNQDEVSKWTSKLDELSRN